MGTNKGHRYMAKTHKIEVEDSDIPLIIIEDASLQDKSNLQAQTSLTDAEENFTLKQRHLGSQMFKMDSVRKRATKQSGKSFLDSTDLRTLVYSELPSFRKRCESIVKKESKRFSRLSFSSFGFGHKNTMDSQISRVSTAARNTVLGDIAETIVGSNEVVIEDSACTNNRASAFDIMLRLQSSNEDYCLHSRVKKQATLRNSRKFSQLLSEPNTNSELAGLMMMERETPLSIASEEFQSHPKKLAKGFRLATDTLSDYLHQVNFWSHQFKEIEGHFGIAVTTYFRFARWLVKINFMVFVLYFCFLYVPQLSHTSIFDSIYIGNASEDYTEKAFRCSREYSEYIDNITESTRGISIFLDIVQGTGYLEKSMLFYGYYSNLTFWLSGKEGKFFEVKYNMGLGYLLTVGMSFIIVFIMIVRNSSDTVKGSVMDFNNKAFPLYTNAVFNGWDYCINREKTAFFKQKIIYNELKATLEEVELTRRRVNRTPKEITQLYLKRIGINLVVIAILVASFYAIYVTTDYLITKQKENLNEMVFLLINYLPPIVISVLNLVIPEVFLALTVLEEYSNSFATHITIIRSVFLRLSSVGVLIVSLYIRLQYEVNRPNIPCGEEFRINATETKCCGNMLWKPDTDTENEFSGKGTVKCWETYVGQQFYKLVIADFLSVTLAILLHKVPRRLLYDSLKDRFWIVSKMGLANFDLPIQVLDILYTQTLCWMGMFFSPLFPAISCVQVFIYFFLKKFELVSLSDPPQNAYRASRSYSFFQIVLLLSFIMISCLLGYMIGNFQPSMSCGPFRIYSSPNFVMFSALTNEINSWPEVPRGIVRYFGTVAFFLPAFLILLLGIYYYWAIATGYKKMEQLLKMQLKSEAHDKQYLLARVDEIIKRGELNPDDYK